MAVPWLLFLSLSTLAASVLAQPGFISIDCGLGRDYTYELGDTEMTYRSDAGFVDTGVDRDLPEVIMPPNLKRFYKNVRSFPNGSRNCYSFGPADEGYKYLIRAYFLYGNYDNKNNTPQFNLSIGVNHWTTIRISNVSEAFYREIITVATTDNIFVCLVNTGKGTPFISALELRQLKSNVYGAANESQSLILNRRRDVGSIDGNDIRYPTDSSDLIWTPKREPTWSPISTNYNVINEHGSVDPPSLVMKTAVKPVNHSLPLGYTWSADDPTLHFQVYMHFAELEQLNPSTTIREFSVCCYDWCYADDPFSPKYLVTDTIPTTQPLTGKFEYTCTFKKTIRSDLPPILNAIETYIILPLLATPTKTQDVKALNGIKATYKVKRNWMGDPCLPKDYLWEGVTCNYRDSGPPTIVSLDLSSAGLNGKIAPSLANLMSVESLDLSRNNLSGRIPDFLGDLASLSLLNLTGNQLSGTIPLVLQERSNKGLLKLSVNGNPNLDVSDANNKQAIGSTSNRIKIIVPVVALVAFTVILLIVLWTCKRRKQDLSIKIKKACGLTHHNQHTKFSSLHSVNRQFTYAEVVGITDNFRRIIGRGGFGTVYHGQMSDGTQVAVKMISSQSVKLLSQPTQCFNQFQNEAQILMRVHHRNLVSFIGYSQAGDNMALIYEFMAQGNLESHLLGTGNQLLSWGQRLHIAMDVALGLEYLHNYCKPAIIHRDMKTTNILLNERWEAKIGDFGFSKVFCKDDELTRVSSTLSAVKGTPGYLDPEYYTSNNLTEKSDVYSFGVVLLQLITGRLAVYRNSDNGMRTIVDWAGPIMVRGDIQEVVDPRMEGHFDVNSLWKVVEIALACTRPRSIERPTVSNVVSELKECVETEMASERSRVLKMDQVEMGSSSSLYPLPR